MRSRVSRVWISIVGAALLGAGGVASCKEEATRTVTIDLGIDNRGSPGFGCIEEPSLGCSAVLECSLRAADRDPCFRDACFDGGMPTRECERMVGCMRDASPATCYERTCLDLPPLLARAVDGAANIHLYVDYVRLGGTPGCRTAELREWCRAGKCSLMRRHCIALSIDASAATSAESAMRAVSEAFGGARTLDDRAPDEPVIVRITGVAKNGPCTAEEEQSLADPNPGPTAIGCAVSCPTLLTATTGAVTVDLDLLGNTCVESTLRQCLSLFHDEVDAAR
jgi:hypothetical protein